MPTHADTKRHIPLHTVPHPLQVNTLKEKQTFEFRLGDLFRKKNVSAVMVDWDQNGM